MESNVNDSMISATEEKEEEIKQPQTKNEPKPETKEEEKPLEMSYKPQIIEDVSNIHSIEGNLNEFMSKNTSQFDLS